MPANQQGGLIRHYGLGLASFVCALPCLLLMIAGAFLLPSVLPAGLALIAVGVLALLGVIVLFGVANTVFNAVLYHWATNRAAPEGVDPAVLSGAFTQRSR